MRGRDIVYTRSCSFYLQFAIYFQLFMNHFCKSDLSLHLKAESPRERGPVMTTDTIFMFVRLRLDLFLYAATVASFVICHHKNALRLLIASLGFRNSAPTVV